MACERPRDGNPLFCYTSATLENNDDLLYSSIRPNDPSLYSLRAFPPTTAPVPQPNSSDSPSRYFLKDDFADLNVSLYEPFIPIDLEENGSNHLKNVIAGGDDMPSTLPSTFQCEKVNPHTGRVGQDGIYHQTSQLGLGVTATGHLLEDHTPESSDPNPSLFRCHWKDCGYKGGFTRKGSLLRHVKNIHIEPYSFECPVEACSKHFNRKDNLDNHIRCKH
ncbi:hypothetical protein N7528_007376 [Penicillium herquei]|nr:hypothetical protein N7528_007376 [Penicillium herquei]